MKKTTYDQLKILVNSIEMALLETTDNETSADLEDILDQLRDILDKDPPEESAVEKLKKEIEILRENLRRKDLLTKKNYDSE